MKLLLVNMIAATGLIISSNAFPADMAELEKKLQCSACHAIDKKILGPSWLEVSKAYNGGGVTRTGKKVADILAGKPAEDWLVKKISEGGEGNWGTMPMPTLDPDGANQAEIRELVKSILGLAKPGASLPESTVAEMTYTPVARKKGDLQALTNKYKCTSCHALDKSARGPSWMEISKAYSNNGKTRTGKKVSEILRFHTAEKWLLLKISEGGSGNWGNQVMPANDPDYQHESDTMEIVSLILELAH